MSKLAVAAQNVLRRHSHVTLHKLARLMRVEQKRVCWAMHWWTELGYISPSSKRPGLYKLGPVSAGDHEPEPRNILNDDALYLLGQLRHGPLRLVELVELLDSGLAATQAALAELRREGLVTVRPGGPIKLTDAGRARSEVEP